MEAHIGRKGRMNDCVGGIGGWSLDGNTFAFLFFHVLRICKLFHCSLGAYLLSPGYLSSVLCCVFYIELRIPIFCVVCVVALWMDGWVDGGVVSVLRDGDDDDRRGY